MPAFGMDSKANLSGPEKAVLFLLSLDETVAAPIVNELTVTDLRKLREVAATMREVSSDALDSTYKDFIHRTDAAIAVPRGGLPYLKRLAVGALGPRRAHEVFDPTALPSSPLRRLEHAAPDAVASILERESPQLIAAIVARLEPRTAADILAALDSDQEAEVLLCMARMTDLPAGVLEDVATAITDELPSPDAETLITIDGIGKAAEILNAAGRQQSTQILEAIEQEEPDVARDVRMAMFTFEDLQKVDPKSMRDLMREVSTEKLTLALKDAPTQLMDAMLSGLSERAGKLVRDDIEILGRVRKTDIEAARREVVQVALRLEAEGTIDLGREDE
jgi:flagellar motor switch protein FliG